MEKCRSNRGDPEAPNIFASFIPGGRGECGSSSIAGGDSGSETTGHDSAATPRL